jgi:hypothetical protein
MNKWQLAAQGGLYSAAVDVLIAWLQERGGLATQQELAFFIVESNPPELSYHAWAEMITFCSQTDFYFRRYDELLVLTDEGQRLRNQMKTKDEVAK